MIVIVRCYFRISFIIMSHDLPSFTNGKKVITDQLHARLAHYNEVSPSSVFTPNRRFRMAIFGLWYFRFLSMNIIYLGLLVIEIQK